MIKLFPHQDDVLNQTYEHNRVAYYLDMGLGKTFVGSEKMWELNTPYNILICQKSKIDDWKEHFEEHYDYTVIVFDKQKIEMVPPESIIIINYDKVWRRDEINKLRNFTMMLDESSMIKNEKSKRSKMILKLPAENIILLSGTPTGGKYEELYSQLRLLGWDISYKTFIRSYVVREWDEMKAEWNITGYKHVDRLKRKLRTYGAVFMKTEEVFDLPDQTDIYVKVKATKLYNTFRRDFIIETPELTLIGDTPSKAKLYLRQLAGQYNQNKLDKLRDMMASTNDRLIIFYNFKEEYKRIKQIADELEKPVATISGDLKDLTAYNNYENSITLVQYQAGAMGHNLQKANKIVYFSLTDKSILFDQSKKRTHRIGQEKTCFYYYMMTHGSIEWRMLESLRTQTDYTDELFREEEMRE
ncbi:DEAD/DEAH box helicase [Listeria booriae]|nr:DEAD/DEAH box helicase [Listeria booriae]